MALCSARRVARATQLSIYLSILDLFGLALLGHFVAATGADPVSVRSLAESFSEPFNSTDLGQMFTTPLRCCNSTEAKAYV